MRALGASEADLSAYRARATADESGLELLRANATSAVAFFSVSTAWDQIAAPSGRLIRTGLRWIDVSARLERIAAYRALDDRGRDRLYEDLAVMERAALSEMASR